MTCIMNFALWVDFKTCQIFKLLSVLPFLFGRGQVILTAFEQSPQMGAVLASENVISKVLGLFACVWCR